MKIHTKLQALSAIIFTSFAGNSFALTEILMNDNGHPVHIRTNNNDLIQLYALPFGGKYIYQKNKSVMFVKHPALGDDYYMVSLNAFNAIEADVNKSTEQKIQDDLQTASWEVSINRETCATVETSPSLGKQLGINVSDVANMNFILSDLFAPQQEQGCMKYRLAKVIGDVMGFPLRSISKAGDAQTVEIKETSKGKLYEPVVYKQLTTMHRVKLLKSIMPPKLLETYNMQNNSLLDSEMQYKAMVNMLRNAQK